MNVNIAAIIACRLKSTRLRKKALLKVGNLTSIELCLKNILKVENLNQVILATSDLPEDTELKKYTYSDNVIFHVGDPVDVIERYLTAIDLYKVDVVIRLTGDCPYPSNEIIQTLMKSHFETGADYTAAKKSAIGTDPQIFNTTTLKKIRELFPKTDYSEYMNAYVVNNPQCFKINLVDLPYNLVRNYRLTLDYKEDLDVFRKIERYFHENNLEFSLPKLFLFLDANPDIAKINQKMHIKYVHDKKLVKEIKMATTYRNYIIN